MRPKITKDMQDLVVFVEIVDQGSFQAAAQTLGFSVGSVSTYLTRLEKSLGMPLLYRNTRSSSLTENGSRIYECAREIISIYSNDVLGQSGDIQGRIKRLRLSVPALFADSPFIDLLCAFMREHSSVNIELVFTDSRSDLVFDGIDLAIRIGDLPDSTLRAKQIARLHRTVVASNGLIDEYGPIYSPERLQDMPWIGLQMRPNRRVFRNEQGSIRTIRYKPLVTANSVVGAYALAKQGVGLAAPPDFMWYGDGQRDIVRPVLPAWTIDPLPVFAVWPNNVARHSLVHQFVDYLSKSAREKYQNEF